jgi:hypothetical protein
MLVQTFRDDIFTFRGAIEAFGQGDGSLELHFLGYLLQMVFLDASEDSRENEGVVDLVLEVTSPTSIDEGTISLCLFRQYFRDWVGQREDNRLFIHRLNPFALQSTFS